MEDIEIEIDKIIRDIRCPECGDSFSPGSDTSSRLANPDAKPEKKACWDFKEELNEKANRVRDGASLSEFRSWAQKYMVMR